jgi:hypothetical protein
MSSRAAVLGSALLLLAGCLSEPTAPAGPGLTGLLADEAGQPLAYVNVMACRSDVCFYSDSDAAGRFEFLLDAPGDLLIKTRENLGANPRLGAAMVPVAISGTEFLDVGMVHVPSLPGGARVPADRGRRVNLETGDGLTLVLDPSELELQPGEALVDVAARRLPESIVPEYAALSDERVLAVYALHPFAATSRNAVGIQLESDLAAGTTVLFRTIDEIDGRFSEPVPGVATGTSLMTEEGTGINVLTHLVVSSPRGD